MQCIFALDMPTCWQCSLIEAQEVAWGSVRARVVAHACSCTCRGEGSRLILPSSSGRAWMISRALPSLPSSPLPFLLLQVHHIPGLLIWKACSGDVYSRRPRRNRVYRRTVDGLCKPRTRGTFPRFRYTLTVLVPPWTFSTDREFLLLLPP